MFKKLEAKVVRRGRYYFVIVQECYSILGIRFLKSGWRMTEPRFISKTEALKLADNIKDYMKGKYNPVSAR